MKIQNSVEVIVRGNPVKQHFFNENLWVAAQKGQTYEVKVKNLTAGRLMAVLSIDGVDCLSGKESDEKSSGYIISPYDSLRIKGFRTSNEEVSLFEFSSKSESYALKSEDGAQSTANCGVIAVHLYEEKKKPLPCLAPIKKNKWPEIHPDADPYYPWNPYYPSPPKGPIWRNDDIICRGNNFNLDYQTKGFSSEPLRSASLNFSASCPNFDVGTKFSDQSVEDKVVSVNFEIGDLREEVLIYYASRKSLEAMGIEFETVNKIKLPVPFKNNGFCKKPR